MESDHYDAIILGAGAAGLMSRRAGRPSVAAACCWSSMPTGRARRS
jgi:succinate dehydrogenase/fumarate reductase flavoprotein subunit